MKPLEPAYISEPIVIHGIKSGHIIRTGIPGDGSCYFHSIAYALNWKNYREQRDKRAHMAQMRSEFSKAFSLSDLKKSTYYHSLTDWVNNALSYFIENPQPTDVEITEFVNKKYREQQHLDRTICTKVIFDAFHSLLHKHHAAESSLSLLEYIHQLRETERFAQIHDIHELFARHVRCTLNIYTYWPDADALLQYTADFFQKNIFIVQEQNGIIYPSSFSGNTYPESIIILHVDGTHFEIVGVQHGDHAQYVFSTREDLHRQLCRKFKGKCKLQGGYTLSSSVSPVPPPFIQTMPKVLYGICGVWGVFSVLYGYQLYTAYDTGISSEYMNYIYTILQHITLFFMILHIAYVAFVFTRYSTIFYRPTQSRMFTRQKGVYYYSLLSVALMYWSARKCHSSVKYEPRDSYFLYWYSLWGVSTVLSVITSLRVIALYTVNYMDTYELVLLAQMYLIGCIVKNREKIKYPIE